MRMMRTCPIPSRPGSDFNPSLEQTHSSPASTCSPRTVAVQEQALTRHRDLEVRGFEKRLVKLAQDEAAARHTGNDKGANQLSSLSNAVHRQMRKLKENVGGRLARIQRRRRFPPSMSEIACLVVEVPP